MSDSTALTSTVTLKHMHDSSDPMDNIGSDAFAFYVGGMTPHAWTLAQLNMQGHKPCLPIWVYGSNPNIRGAQYESHLCVMALKRLGFPVGHPIAIDMETSVDGDYIDMFVTELNLFNYWGVVYGSQGFIFKNPQRGGYWVATLNGNPTMYPHSGVVATQWRDFGPFDDSLITTTFYNQLWHR